MPKVDLAAVPERSGVDDPAPFAAQSAGRLRRRLDDAGGLRDFGVALTTMPPGNCMPPGNWSTRRHGYCGISRR